MPTDASVNQRRGHLGFDEGGSPEGEAPDTFLNGDSFERRDAVKGDVARALFYVDVRYEGWFGEPDLVLVDGTTGSGNRMGDLCTLLEWHLADPVATEEIARNDAIKAFQGNRNLFIDDPDLAGHLYGAKCGVSETEVIGDTGTGDGTGTVIEIMTETLTGGWRIGTWNIANLHHESGVALRDGSVARDDVDFDRLAAFAADLDLDIIALQEIGSPAAAARIFPENR